MNEKVAADKRELEVLPRKFDEKIKELNDANARLVAQDEGYRDIQRRKAELSNAISKLEQADTKGDSQAFLMGKLLFQAFHMGTLNLLPNTMGIGISSTMKNLREVPL